MSSRLGTGGSNLIDEAVKQVSDVSRAGRGFRVALEAEGRHVGAGEALQRAVEQRLVRHAAGGRQRGRVHGEAMVLAQRRLSDLPAQFL